MTNFSFSNDNDEECVMHSKNYNIEIMCHDEADEVMEELFDSILSRNRIGLEMSMKGCEYVSDCVHLLYYECHKINSNQGGSYTVLPDWKKNKKARINLINKKDKSFKYVIIVALNHEEIGKNSQRISNIEPFISKCNWEEINYPSKKVEYEKFGKNNPTTALNVFRKLKKKKFILPTFQNITQSIKNKLFF